MKKKDRPFTNTLVVTMFSLESDCFFHTKQKGDYFFHTKNLYCFGVTFYQNISFKAAMSDYLSFASFKSIFFHIILRYNIYFDINTSPLPLFFFSYFIKSPMFAFTRLSFRTLLKQIITCRYFSSCTTHDRCH